MIQVDTLQHVTSLDECWWHLDRESFGRLAVATDVGVDIFPVNFTAHDREIYLRSAPGSKLADIVKRPGVAFEIDGRQSGMHWSVVVKGDATRMSSDADIRASGVLEGLPEKDAAAILGVPPGTVKSRLSRAKARLANRLPHPPRWKEAINETD